jgi:hypothetical protein
MKFHDLSGQQFGDLTALEIDHKDKFNNFVWKCKCSCGNYRLVSRQMLCSGTITSCGCKNYQSSGTHKCSKEPLYNIWKLMKQRCYNPKSKSYRYYGGRGVIIDDNWVYDYMNFKQWAESNGYENGLTIDRIDVNGNYCPENCRWITMKEQCSNRRSNRFITYNGKTQTLSQWAEETGINLRTIKSRVDIRGWSIEQALSTPPKQRRGYAHG